MSYSNTAVQWAVYVREIFKEHFYRIIAKHHFAGVVEIDESYFGRRRNYHRGQNVGLSVWIVGLIERDSNRLILYPVENRSKETLNWIIQRHVSVGSTVYTDGWRRYNDLQELGYTHYTVDHVHEYTRVYKHVTTGEEVLVHTNTIEGAWAHAKAHFKKMHGTSGTQFEGHLCEVMWRNWNRGAAVYNAFFHFLRGIYSTTASPQYTYPTPVFPTWCNEESRIEDLNESTVSPDERTMLNKPQRRKLSLDGDYNIECEG